MTMKVPFYPLQYNIIRLHIILSNKSNRYQVIIQIRSTKSNRKLHTITSFTDHYNLLLAFMIS